MKAGLPVSGVVNSSGLRAASEFIADRSSVKLWVALVMMSPYPCSTVAAGSICRWYATEIAAVDPLPFEVGVWAFPVVFVVGPVGPAVLACMLRGEGRDVGHVVGVGVADAVGADPFHDLRVVPPVQGPCG